MARLELRATAEAVPTVYNFDGQVSDIEWLRETFGGVAWKRCEPHPEAAYVFRLVELRAKCGPASQVVMVLDENDQPLVNYAVIRHWPGAPKLPDFGGTTAKQWTETGVVGKTNINGDVGFGMGKGDYYFPDQGQSGVSKVYVADFDGPGDLLENLGMLGGTEHCHIDAKFKRVLKDQEPDPDPEPGEPGDWTLDLHIQGTISRVPKPD